MASVEFDRQAFVPASAPGRRSAFQMLSSLLLALALDAYRICRLQGLLSERAKQRSCNCELSSPAT